MNGPFLDGEVVPPDDSESEHEASYVILVIINNYIALLIE